MSETDKAAEEGEWLIHKAGRGWFRPNAQGYTADPADAGRYSHADALSYSHPNGWDGPRDEITIKPVSEVISAATEAGPVAWMIEDLILTSTSITTEQDYAKRRKEYLYEGEATAKVTPLYAHPQDAESLRGEVGPIRELTEEDHANIVAHLSPELEPRGPLPNANSLMMAIVYLRNELATSRAETAMAFEVAAQRCRAEQARRNAQHRAESALPAAKIDVAQSIRFRAGATQAAELADIIRAIPSADATAALAARDKATREQALRDAAAIAKQNREHWLCAAGFEGFATGAKIISDAILSLIQEENQ